MLSLLVLFLELIQALVREAVSIGLMSHRHPVYIYDPLVQCNTSTGADNRNVTSSNACKQEAGIALLVILAALADVVPWVLFLIVSAADPLPRILKRSCQLKSIVDYTCPEEHMFPIIASLYNIHVRQFDIQECKHQKEHKNKGHKGQ